MNKKVIFIIIGLVIVVLLGLFFIFYRNFLGPLHSTSIPASSQGQAKLNQPQKMKTPIIADSIAQFKSRITKKPFGIYITPQTSPVQPERFTGYHTGDDVEYGDVAGDVPVYAVYDGTIVLSQFVSGYGGTIVLRCNINGEDLYVLYGHLNPASLTPANTQVTKGQQIAILGQGYTQQTDNERKHLHFSIHKGSLDLRGYVQNQGELSGWYDPIQFYKQINGT
jgi:murein DD-endopeptidase MepM/ murein hydrolase activator NlpD